MFPSESLELSSFQKTVIEHPRWLISVKQQYLKTEESTFTENWPAQGIFGVYCPIFLLLVDCEASVYHVYISVC